MPQLLYDYVRQPRFVFCRVADVGEAIAWAAARRSVTSDLLLSLGIDLNHQLPMVGSRKDSMQALRERLESQHNLLF